MTAKTYSVYILSCDMKDCTTRQTIIKESDPLTEQQAKMEGWRTWQSDHDMDFAHRAAVHACPTCVREARTRSKGNRGREEATESSILQSVKEQLHGN